MSVSLNDLLTGLHELSRLDKIRVIRALAEDLAHDESSLIEAGRSYPIWSPDTAFSAADVMLQALAEDRARP
jgi:hypothetical protein